MAAQWIQGVYVGCQHINFTKKDGKEVDFYNFCFKVKEPENAVGSVYDVLTSYEPKSFPQLLDEKNIGKDCRFIKNKNYLFLLDMK